ncbi:MAG TPA: gluconate 2-dehydrogenase subunit 3 family protein [Steroidobacteraceae bacterium]|nr:gluconate 2-dehydrogenase subunit 3 family protein [Steroidobacteraceae bacterium]
MTDIRRRDLLVGTAFALLGKAAGADVIAGALPWSPNAASPPLPVHPGGWHFFTEAESALAEALADRIIPPDPGPRGTPVAVPGSAAAAATTPAAGSATRDTARASGSAHANGTGSTSGATGASGPAPDYRTEWCPGGREAGCAVFLDRQLAGPYGQSEGLYRKGPFQKGSKTQGEQNPETPAQLYRRWLAALDKYARSLQDGKPFVEMSTDRQDVILAGLESGSVELEGVDAKDFFKHLVMDLQTGFFADPLYGGNRAMCAWKMIGYPGAHYDYRDWIDRHNERYPHPPVAITGAPGWIPRS